MDNNDWVKKLAPILKLLLNGGIALLGKLIPFLGTLTGLPGVGWLVGVALGFLSNLLAKMIVLELQIRGVDAAVEAKATEEALQKWRELQKLEASASTPEEKVQAAKEKENARKVLDDAFAKLIDLRR